MGVLYIPDIFVVKGNLSQRKEIQIFLVCLEFGGFVLKKILFGWLVGLGFVFGFAFFLKESC